MSIHARLHMAPNSLWIVCSLTIATALKFYLATFTVGTNDVVTWVSFLHNIREVGGAAAYHVPGAYGNPFNHPPFMVHFLLLVGFIGDTAHIPFPLLLRTPAILADIGSVILVNRLCTEQGFRCSQSAIVAMALCPVSILVSGFHGNTDPVMVFFIVASIYLLELRGFVWAAGLAFGMAINIKVVPLIFVPAIFFYLKNWRARVTFFVSAIVIILLCWMPYFAQDPVAIIKGTLGYSGISAAPWGLSSLLYALGLTHIPALYPFLRAIIVTSATIVAYWMNRHGTDLYTQTGVVVFLFLFLTPSFGVQYLAWAVPFVLTLGTRWTLAYYFSTGVFLFLVYDHWSRGTWYFADSHPGWNPISRRVGYLCWSLTALALIRYRHKIVDAHLHSSSTPATLPCAPGPDEDTRSI